MIPVPIKVKIHDFATTYRAASITESAEFGYSLASEQLKEKDKEIERLKTLIKEGFIALNQEWGKSVGQIDKDWLKFKTENQL